MVKLLVSAKANLNANLGDGIIGFFLGEKPGESFDDKVNGATRQEIQRYLSEEREKRKTERMIKCRFGNDLVKMPCHKKTTFEEFIGMVEREWGEGKGMKYRDKNGDVVAMATTEELMWVRGKAQSVMVEVFSKASQVYFLIFSIF